MVKWDFRSSSLLSYFNLGSSGARTPSLGDNTVLRGVPYTENPEDTFPPLLHHGRDTSINSANTTTTASLRRVECTTTDGTIAWPVPASPTVGTDLRFLDTPRLDKVQATLLQRLVGKIWNSSLLQQGDVDNRGQIRKRKAMMKVSASKGVNIPQIYAKFMQLYVA
jgi:hypothetical protein